MNIRVSEKTKSDAHLFINCTKPPAWSKVKKLFLTVKRSSSQTLKSQTVLTCPVVKSNIDISNLDSSTGYNVSVLYLAESGLGVECNITFFSTLSGKC